jgi:hypothetical protein
MLIFFTGSIFGQFDKFHESVLHLEKKIGTKVDWILSTGNLGVWPDPVRADRATRKNGGAGDFARYYLNGTAFLRPTLFVAGRHEDHAWLKLKLSRQEMTILYNLHWLVNGYSTILQGTEGPMTVVGLGKVFSPSVFNSTGNKNTEGRYYRSEVEKACSQGPTDLFLSHQGPAGAQFGNIKSNSEGVNKIAFAVRPKLFVHGGYNTSKQYRAPMTNVETISLKNGEILPVEWDGKRFSLI